MIAHARCCRADEKQARRERIDCTGRRVARRTRARAGLWIGPVLGLLATLCAADGGPPNADEASGVTIVAPHARAVLSGGDVDLICKAAGATLEVDGKAHPWESFKPPLRVAHLKLEPGRHEVRVGAQRVELFVADGSDQGGPEGWPVYAVHPVKDEKGRERCQGCHEVGQHDGLVSVGEVKSYESCFKCHPSVEFEVIHAHPLQPLEPCQMCHALHGSPRDALLKAPIRVLCSECHEAGH
jgi:predicted CXXCH cytochrome family protein